MAIPFESEQWLLGAPRVKRRSCVRTLRSSYVMAATLAANRRDVKQPSFCADSIPFWAGEFWAAFGQSPTTGYFTIPLTNALSQLSSRSVFAYEV